jgi:hypothetical protein
MLLLIVSFNSNKHVFNLLLHKYKINQHNYGLVHSVVELNLHLEALLLTLVKVGLNHRFLTFIKLCVLRRQYWALLGWLEQLHWHHR